MKMLQPFLASPIAMALPMPDICEIMGQVNALQGNEEASVVEISEPDEAPVTKATWSFKLRVLISMDRLYGPKSASPQVHTEKPLP
jgi:hypothetical protein